MISIGFMWGSNKTAKAQRGRGAESRQRVGRDGTSIQPFSLRPLLLCGFFAVSLRFQGVVGGSYF
jgi:hypothetical protein